MRLCRIIALAVSILGVPLASAVDLDVSRNLTEHHRLSVKALELSLAPTTEDLMAAGQLGGALFPTHELKNGLRDHNARLDFGKAIEEWNKHEYPKAVSI